MKRRSLDREEELIVVFNQTLKTCILLQIQAL